MSAGERGFTLLEVLVASALSLLLLGLVAGILLPGMRTSARETARAEMQQQAVLAVQRVTDALETSGPAGIGLLPADPLDSKAPVAVGLVPLQGATAEGQQVWAQRLRVFWWDRRGRRLYARWWPPAPPSGLPYTFDPTRPRRPGASTLERICEEPAGDEALLASGVDDFRVDAAGQGTAVASPVTVLLAVSRDIPGVPQRERFVHARAVALRNSL